MSTLGFYCFTSPEVVVELTLEQKIAVIPNAKKVEILNAFIMRIPAAHLDHKIGIAKELIESIYDLISNLQDTAKLYLKGTYIITPEVSHIDPTTLQKIIDTPAVYNVIPTTQVALGTALQPLFTDFTTVQVTAIVSAMVKWSKYDGSGTFAFYKSQVIL